MLSILLIKVGQLSELTKESIHNSILLTKRYSAIYNLFEIFHEKALADNLCHQF